ncbi:hypothetical protein [Pseudomonas glycinae]|uniref:Uncharacterized protein n=1 Tax=Pseudomonas glycinae TaxID=1785145 RepID=A0ABM6QI84_9PSED|nr:hypothetical protein [Pseudomonas glycinae]AUG97619.1 hypothetical protein AWU82_29855 [Pseudomonas glycinae]
MDLNEIATNGVAYVDQDALTSDQQWRNTVRRDQHQRERELLQAAHTGSVLDLLLNLRPGRWLSSKAALALVV